MIFLLQFARYFTFCRDSILHCFVQEGKQSALSCKRWYFDKRSTIDEWIMMGHSMSRAQNENWQTNTQTLSLICIGAMMQKCIYFFQIEIFVTNLLRINVGMSVIWWDINRKACFYLHDSKNAVEAIIFVLVIIRKRCQK